MNRHAHCYYSNIATIICPINPVYLEISLSVEGRSLKNAFKKRFAGSSSPLDSKSNNWQFNNYHLAPQSSLKLQWSKDLWEGKLIICITVAPHSIVHGTKEINTLDLEWLFISLRIQAHNRLLRFHLLGGKKDHS